MISFIKKRKLLLILLFSGGFFIILFSSALAAELGETITFFVDSNYDKDSRTELTATLRKISDRAYFYVEDEYWETLSGAQQNTYTDYLNDVAREFDRTTYSAVRYVFGSEWKPGIDNDERITILLSRLASNFGGYFNGKDEVSKTRNSTSNEREMFYINATQIANPLINSLLAHEFQHLISWNYKENEHWIVDEIWLNELRSEYAPTAAGYDSEYVGTNLERRVDDFLANPFDSLTEWVGGRYDYPSVNLFGHYLAEQFGEEVFSHMLENSRVGIYSVEQALDDMGFNFNFSQIFNNWSVANYLNNSSLSDGRYGYKDPYLKGAVQVSPITYSIVSTSIINIAQNIKDWTPYLYRFINKQDSGTIAKDLEIEFEGSTNRGGFNVIYIVEYKSGKITIGSLDLSNQEGVLKIPDFRDDVKSATVVISNQFKKAGFLIGDSEPLTPFVLSVATTIFEEPVPEPEPEPEPNPNGRVKPEDYGLQEGDLIRAQGDFDIFIINQYGYKRLFLNPVIFEMYGHLGSWDDVITVTPETRDAFLTSPHYRYVDEDKVYHLEVSGEDTGTLHWLNITGDSFIAQGGEPEAIFVINKSEFDWYPRGTDKTSL